MAIGESQLDQDGSQGGDGVDAKVGWRYTLRKIKRDTTARWGLYVVGFVMLVAAYATVDTHLSRFTFGMASDYAVANAVPFLDHPTHIPEPGEGESHVPPAFLAEGTWSHPLGTDPDGRDYLTRIIYGTRVSVSVGIGATGFALFFGTIVGAVSGYYGGWVDDTLMRAVEILYAIPPLILIIVITVFVGDTSLHWIVIGVGVAFIPVFARIIRSQVLSVREMDYIEAARAAGVRDRHIIFKHIVPNSFAPLLVYATLQIGVTILIVAGLSFLGYGVQPPTPDWGQMLNISHGYMHSNIWLSIWPGVAIMITIMGFNLFGDGLQDALDPRIDN
ncbi:ABC transporter permease [Halovivax gelatinilyticus]|uniref:ABC transporter permease n=1 Tax=Halovivax gelatinilyticus TaxID=2961597 RepID=UPI0020CA4CA0|nr:ABC transporter permease [Halovivax gelatinilyticus]